MTTKRLVTIGTVLAIIAVGLIYWFVLRAPEEASAPIEAIPLEVQATEAPAEPTPEAPTGEPPTEVPPTATAVVEEAAEEATEVPEEPTATPEPTEEPTATPEPTVAAAPVIYEISQEESQVRFELDEELAGQPNTVIGTTDQVAGQMAVDFNSLSATQVGIIQVNARTLLTDNNFRNNSIRNRILHTDQYEFITFTPTSLEGLPDSVAIGETVTFSMIGDLTIQDVTTEVTFEVEATAVSETQISGTASTIIMREAYNLVIPTVPNVANVEEEVELYIDFVANAVEQ